MRPHDVVLVAVDDVPLDEAVELVALLSAELVLDELSVAVPDVEPVSVLVDVVVDVELFDDPPRLSVL
jgi:hypothetical protein